MPLYLVRHGEAYSEDVYPEPSLTESGKATVHRMAQMVAASKISVSRICHSEKNRARQTADILSHYLKPSAGITEMKGLKPYDNVALIVPQLDATPNAMFVGHLPFMERLVTYLITGSTDRTVIRFQTSGIVCLDQTASHESWHIKWALMPQLG